ncbi:Fic family protein [Nocardia stercoris]|nr:Fic family protein [Nocardia stercoris]
MREQLTAVTKQAAEIVHGEETAAIAALRSKAGTVLADDESAGRLLGGPAAPTAHTWTGNEPPETILGLHTRAQVMQEASLVIDKPLMEVALAQGYSNPEILFGRGAWSDYLDARAFTRLHGDQDLSVDFVTDLHRKLAPSLDGQFTPKRRRGSWDRPVTDSEVAAIEANPHVKFLTSEIVPLKNWGIEYVTNGREAIERELKATADWYNTARQQPGYDPYHLAAELQHRIVSIHPFEDFNGRVSRLLMNWSLERDGLPPSVLEDFNADIGSSIPDWTDAVRGGSDLYAARAQRIAELGDSADPVDAFGLRQIQGQLEASGRSVRLVPGYAMDIQQCRALLAELGAASG